MLQCLAASGSGGERILVDGFRVAEELRVKDHEAFEGLIRHGVGFR